MDVYVERLHAALTDALRRSRSRPFDEPVTVAEIHQDLVPYRAVRSAIGFEMNADYEHALSQLLSGVDGLAHLEPEAAAAEMREELATPNPNVGIFRKFAECRVWIVPTADENGTTEVAGAAMTRAAALTVEPDRSAPGGDRPGRASRHPSESDPTPDPPSPLRASHAAAPALRATTGPRTTVRCGFCEAKLPAGRNVRFCPECGGDQLRNSCVSCGESLESGWRYCVSCGAAQGASGPA